MSAAPLLQALFAALDGQPAPCTGLADIFTSGDEGDAAVAREHCSSCPARRPCAAYGAAIDATVGTFGGRDMAVRDGRRRPTDDTTTEMERTA